MKTRGVRSQLTPPTRARYGPADMAKACPRPVLAPWFLSALIACAAGALPARAAATTAAAEGPSPQQRAAVTARSLPATSGVRSEAQTTLPVPAEKVAAVLADPQNFVPLFPAHAVDVLSATGDSQVVSVEMRKPWPVGTVKWVEDVVTHREPDGKSFVVERTAHPGYFKHMSARFHVAPDPAAESARCIVTYEVAMELKRWAPEWALRRGNLNGIMDTMARLRMLVLEQKKAPASSPAPVAASLSATAPAAAAPVAPAAPASVDHQ